MWKRHWHSWKQALSKLIKRIAFQGNVVGQWNWSRKIHPINKVLMSHTSFHTVILFWWKTSDPFIWSNINIWPLKYRIWFLTTLKLVVGSLNPMCSHLCQRKNGISVNKDGHLKNNPHLVLNGSELISATTFLKAISWQAVCLLLLPNLIEIHCMKERRHNACIDHKWSRVSGPSQRMHIHTNTRASAILECEQQPSFSTVERNHLHGSRLLHIKEGQILACRWRRCSKVSACRLAHTQRKNSGLRAVCVCVTWSRWQTMVDLPM